MYLSNYIKLLLKYKHLKQNKFAEIALVDQGVISNVLKDKPTGRLNLKRIARAYSELTNIPFDKFKDGQSLLEKDFEKTLEVYFSQQKQPISQNITESSKLNDEIQSDWEALTDYESKLLYRLRILKKNTGKSPLSRATIDRIYKTLKLLDLDSETHISLLDLLSSVRGKNETDKEGP